MSNGASYAISINFLFVGSKPLHGHVQEVSPNNGPITVFLEALVGMHTVAVKNVKPLAFCSSKYRGWWRIVTISHWNFKHRDYFTYCDFYNFQFFTQK